MDESTLSGDIARLTADLAARLAELPTAKRIPALNAVRAALHEVSPFRSEPTDLVQWVPAGEVRGNLYNPNRVAPPELELLRRSVDTDGFTQPLVVHADRGWEVVDGFHRHLVGREEPRLTRLHGHLPVVQLGGTLTDRMAATVRHNRARGKHGVERMAALVEQMQSAGQTSLDVARALGMEAEELLRLCEVGGIAARHAGGGYSRAWEIAEDD